MDARAEVSEAREESLDERRAELRREASREAASRGPQAAEVLLRGAAEDDDGVTREAAQSLLAEAP
jgi:hypothetical protein